MSKTNTKSIYTYSSIPSIDSNVQKVRYNRDQLITKSVAEELNTYLHFGIFPTFADTYYEMYYYDNKGNKTQEKGAVTVGGAEDMYNAPKRNGNKSAEDGSQGRWPGTPGVRSIFNRAGAVVIGSYGGDSASAVYDINLADGDSLHYWRINNNVPLLDSPGARQRIRKNLGCSVRELVQASQQGAMGQETYAYSDFMYCKHLGKMPNNHLITLRRFPYPVDDYIGTTGETVSTRQARASKNSTCIGCMVTWMGVSGNNMNEILKYSYRLPFKEQQSELQDSKTDADSNQSVLGGIFSAFDSNYQKEYMAGRAGESANVAFSHFGINLGNPPYTDHRTFKDRNKVYGPVDAIKSTYIRSDEGIIFNQKITLNFEYELKAYNGINARQAMLDLISNILNVTYTTGSFWGGGIKGNGVAQSNIFTNLNIFKVKGGGFSDYVDAFAKDLSNIGSTISKNLGLSTEMSIGNIFQAFKGILNTLGGMLVGGMLNKMGRPAKAMYNSLLSPAPIGFWHLTIGNPKAPIMSIGNMVITNVTVEHSGPLGLDNFPTGLKITIELDRGKPRDLRDIERLYMHGNDRIYSAMTDKVFDMYKNAALYKSKTGRNNATYGLGDFKDFGNDADDKNTLFKSEIVYTDTNGKTLAATDNFETHANSNKTNVNTAISYGLNIDSINSIIRNDDTLKNSLQKYFGTNDAFSIWVAATEQEYGSGKQKKITGTVRPAANNDKK